MRNPIYAGLALGAFWLGCGSGQGSTGADSGPEALGDGVDVEYDGVPEDRRDGADGTNATDVADAVDAGDVSIDVARDVPPADAHDASPEARSAFQVHAGAYHWDKGVALVDGVERMTALGIRNAHLLFSVECPQTLTELASSPIGVGTLGHSALDTIQLTAFGGSICGVPTLYVDPGVYTPERIAAVETEFADFTLHLFRTYAGTGKRFILSHWEGDNAVYCSAAYYYATDPKTRADCDANYATWYAGIPSPSESLRGLGIWLAARQKGVARGRMEATAAGLGGVEVWHAPEFNIVHALKDAGFPSVLYDVLAKVPFDAASYSSYESVNATSPAETLRADLDLIAAAIGTRNIVIGEFGFDRTVWGDDVAVDRTSRVVEAAIEWGVPNVFQWVLKDDGHFGLFDKDWNLTPIGRVYESRL